MKTPCPVECVGIAPFVLRVDRLPLRWSVLAVDPVQIQAILNDRPERDDPRLLVRLAFGITSPGLTVNKWSTSHPLSGVWSPRTLTPWSRPSMKNAKEWDSRRTWIHLPRPNQQEDVALVLLRFNFWRGKRQRTRGPGKRARGDMYDFLRQDP